jgi:hypothetical protein
MVFSENAYCGGGCLIVGSDFWKKYYLLGGVPQK